MGTSIVFLINGWVDEDDFRLLTKFSRYLGREDGKSRFSIDFGKLSRAVSEGQISPEEIMALFDSYDVIFEQGSLNDLRKILEDHMPRVVVKMKKDGIYLIPNFYMRDLVGELLREALVYRPQEGFKLAKPMYFFDVLDTLSKRGIVVQDESGLQRELPLPIKLEFKGQLRDYQEEALAKWRGNRFKGIVALPTGTGKTVIAIAALVELNVKTLVVAYTKEQMFQWADKIVEFTGAPRGILGFYYGSEKRLAPITITTYQSAFRYAPVLAPHFSFLIVDEVHHLPADKFRFIAENMYAPYRLGLSATVIREDGKHVELFPLMGGLVYSRSLQELVERGYVAPFRVVRVPVSLTPKEKLKYRELVEKYKKLSRGKEFKELIEEAKRGVPEALEALRIRSEIRSFVAMCESKMEALAAVVEKELQRGSKILVFTQYVEQAKKVAERLGTYYVVGPLDEEARRRRLEAFKQGLVRVLVLTTLGDEGIDVPDANVGIIAAGTGSKRQFLQRLGRLLRPQPGKEARLYELVVKGTFEEAESRRRREALKMLYGSLMVEEEAGSIRV